MGNLKKLTEPKNSKVEVVCPLSNEEIESRQKDYDVLDVVTFAKKYGGGLFKEIMLKYQGEAYRIQMNFCDNPFCKNFGRYTDVNTVTPVEPEYNFHKEGCLVSNLTPIDNSDVFYKRGKSSSNSQKYQCKVCGKYTNVLPTQRECFTYN